MSQEKLLPPTDAEIVEAHELALDCIDHLIGLVAQLTTDMRKITNPVAPDRAARFLGPVLEFSLYPLMESIGDCLSNMDVADEGADAINEKWLKVRRTVEAFKAQYGTDWMSANQAAE